MSAPRHVSLFVFKEKVFSRQVAGSQPFFRGGPILDSMIQLPLQSNYPNQIYGLHEGALLAEHHHKEKLS